MPLEDPVVRQPYLANIAKSFLFNFDVADVKFFHELILFRHDDALVLGPFDCVYS